MIQHLANILSDFPGEANRTRCFTHILNLVARCIMRQFDVPKNSKQADNTNGVEDMADALAELENELDDENGGVVEDDRESDDDSLDGREGMTEEEIAELEESVRPVRQVLNKVSILLPRHHSHHRVLRRFLSQLRKAAHAIKNSTTHILPEWFAILDRLAEAAEAEGQKPLSRRMMPRDIVTRWNYTYEMLSFAYIYRDAYNELTSNRDMKMRDYELEDSEWDIVKQLAKVLKVCIPIIPIL